MKTIACIGAGNIGPVLMKCAVGKAKIGFTDIDKNKAKIAANALKGIVYSSNKEAVKSSDYIFLAVKPQVLGSVLTEISPILLERTAKGKNFVLVSMAAGWPIAKIQAYAGGTAHAPAAKPSQNSIPVLRMMPNLPVLISLGMIAFCTSPKFPQTELAELKDILSGAGSIDHVDESVMDAVTGLSGSSPAFVFQFIEALADGGVLTGLSREKSLHYAAQTVMGSAAMMLRTGMHMGELKDMVASPAGTTIQGIAALERGAFRGAVMSAVEAAWKRAQELG